VDDEVKKAREERNRDGRDVKCEDKKLTRLKEITDKEKKEKERGDIEIEGHTTFFHPRQSRVKEDKKLTRLKEITDKEKKGKERGDIEIE
jgi:hypothetical protein